MKPDNAAIRTYFAKLGLEHEIADMYLALYTHGPQTISELSRNAKVERTRIYRLIDKLMASNLIEVESHYKRGIIKAAPIANLRILISQKEQELKSLQDELGLIEQVLSRNDLSNSATRVQFYQGPEGVKQMFWNQTGSRTEAVSILRENMQTKTNEKFFERWAHTCNEQNLHFRSIVSDTFLASQKQWYAKHDNEKLTHWQGRYLAPNAFPIRHNTVIYSDVTSYFNWKNNEIFGIEIYNQDIADAQRAFFEMLWQTAAPLPQ